MTPVERLEAAIAKLERLRKSEPYHESNGWLAGLVTVGTEHDPREEEEPLTSSELIVTLHRTIDAQLAILKAAREDFAKFGRKPSEFFENDLALADAILGDNS